MNLPKLPSHPEHNHSWTRPELAALSDYGQACAVAALAASEPKAYCGDCGKRNSGVHTCSPQYAASEQKPVNDRYGVMPDTMRDYMTGMSVSMDVSTSEHDADRRYFGVINEVMDCDGDKHGVTLLVYEGEPNFAPSDDSARIKHLTYERDGLHAAMAQIAVYSKTEWASGAACDMREIARAALGDGGAT